MSLVKSVIHAVTGQRYCLGRDVPTMPHHLFLKFGDLVAKGSLPNIVPPKVMDYSLPVSLPGVRNIYKNSDLGCCVVASYAHTLNVQAGQAGNPVIVFPDLEI